MDSAREPPASPAAATAQKSSPKDGEAWRRALLTLAPTGHQPGALLSEAAGFRKPPMACRSASARFLKGLCQGVALAEGPAPDMVRAERMVRSAMQAPRTIPGDIQLRVT
jgi:hypothetical protein